MPNLEAEVDLILFILSVEFVPTAARVSKAASTSLFPSTS